MDCPWDFCFNNCFEEATMVDDKLAKLVVNAAAGVHVLRDPPSLVLDLHGGLTVLGDVGKKK